MFPIRAWEEVDADAATSDNAVTRPTAPSRSFTPVIVAILVLIFLGAALWIYLTRGTQQNTEPTPDRLAGLAYLPADTNIAFVIRTGPILDYAQRTNQDPRQLLVQAGIPNQAFDALTRLGFKLEQIDHLAGGTSQNNDELAIRLTLVLVLREPLEDVDAFLDQVKAKRHPKEGWFRVQLGPLSAVLALESPTLLVLGLDETKDLEAVERGGYEPNGKHFPTELAKLIAEQVPKDAAVWFATNDENWAEKPAVKATTFATGNREWLPVLARGRAAMAAVSLGSEPRLKLFIRTADGETGQRVREFFANEAGENAAVLHGGESDTAFYDTPIEPNRVFATLERFLKAAIKE